MGVGDLLAALGFLLSCLRSAGWANTSHKIRRLRVFGSERLGMGCLRFCTKAFRALTCREASFHARLKSSEGEALNRDRLERSRLETSSRARRPRRRAGASIHSAGCGACSDVAEGSGRCKKRFRPPCWMTQQRLTRPATCLELRLIRTRIPIGATGLLMLLLLGQRGEAAAPSSARATSKDGLWV